MRKILSFIAVTSIALSANESNAADWGKLKLDGIQLVSSKTGNPVQLKGWSTQSMLSTGAWCRGQLQLTKFCRQVFTLCLLSLTALSTLRSCWLSNKK